MLWDATDGEQEQTTATKERAAGTKQKAVKTQTNSPTLEQASFSKGFLKCDGAQAERVYGSYVHGIFDSEEASRGLVEALAQAKGVSLDASAQMDYQAYKESQYDLLADTLRKHLDLEKIYQILEEGI